MSGHCFAHGSFDGMHCPECHGFTRPDPFEKVRFDRLAHERTWLLKALVDCSSHLTELGRPDLAPYRMADLIVCPRCEGQRYDVGGCGVCQNVGWLDECGLALGIDPNGERRSSGLPLLARNTISRAFAARHDSPFMRQIARTSIRDARLWRSMFGGRRA